MSLSDNCPRKCTEVPLCLCYIKVSTNIIILGIDLTYFITYQADGRAALTQNYPHYNNYLLCKATPWNYIFRLFSFVRLPLELKLFGKRDLGPSVEKKLIGVGAESSNKAIKKETDCSAE